MTHLSFTNLTLVRAAARYGITFLSLAAYAGSCPGLHAQGIFGQQSQVSSGLSGGTAMSSSGFGGAAGNSFSSGTTGSGFSNGSTGGTAGRIGGGFGGSGGTGSTGGGRASQGTGSMGGQNNAAQFGQQQGQGGAFIGGGQSLQGVLGGAGNVGRSAQDSALRQQDNQRRFQMDQQQFNNKKPIRMHLNVRFARPVTSPRVVASRLERSLALVGKSQQQRTSLSLSPVQAIVDGRTVTLRGVMRSDDERRVAVRLAKLEPGVSQVVDELTIFP